MSGKLNVGIQLGSGSWTHFLKTFKIIIIIICENWHKSTPFINILDIFQKLKWFIKILFLKLLLTMENYFIVKNFKAKVIYLL